MKVAYVTTCDIRDPSTWPKHFWGLYGGAHFLARALDAESVELQYLGPLRQELPWWAGLKTRWYRALGKRYWGNVESRAMRCLAKQVEEKLRESPCDVLLCFDDGLCLAHLRTSIPVVLYRDTLLHTLFRYYGEFRDLCWETKSSIVRQEKKAIRRCDRVLFASQWAAQAAAEAYHLDADKVKVIPWGASIPQTCVPSPAQIESSIDARSHAPCLRLLFIGVAWERKGGPMAVEVVAGLNARGIRAELRIVGCNPFPEGHVPPFVRLMGALEPGNPEHDRMLQTLLMESHFLIVPSREECFGVVFCEASAFGVPSLTTDTGGIPSAVMNGVNGQRFPVDAPASQYCDFLQALMRDGESYRHLARSAYAEYNRNLNWKVGAQRVTACLRELLP